MAFKPFLSSILEVLEDSEWESLDRPLTLDELTKAVRSFQKSRTPGSDGLPVVLHSALWDWIVSELLDAYGGMLLAGSMSESMRKGFITLIYK